MTITDLYGNDDIEAMYQFAIAVPLEEKISRAILMIQTHEQMALNLSAEGYYVCFSGGKDSIVMAKLFEMAGVKYNLNYSNVTIDPPELVRFIKREYPQAIWHNPKKHILRHMVDNYQGLPTRVMRWCCSIYKEQGGNGLFKAVGVRAAESARRKGLWQPIRVIPGQRVPVMSPILYWSDADVWQFIRDNEMKYCSLYDEGYNRLGCIGCPMSGRKGRLRDFARWPRYEKMWKQAAQAWLDKWRTVPRRDGKPRSNVQYKTVEEYWAWWMEDANVNDTDNADCQMFLW